MSYRGARLSEQHRQRIGAGIRRFHQRRRMAAEIAPRDLERLEKSGTIAPSLQPLVEIARMESTELIDALGGAEAIKRLTLSSPSSAIASCSRRV